MRSKRGSLSIVFVVAGVGFLVAGAYALVEGAASLMWPTAPGTVVAADIVSRPSTRSTSAEHPVITYAYEVDGVTYQSSRLSIVSGSYTDSEAEDAVARYAPGTKVDVRYDPDAPGSAVLEPGGSLGFPAGMAAGAIVMVAFAYFESRSRRRELSAAEQEKLDLIRRFEEGSDEGEPPAPERAPMPNDPHELRREAEKALAAGDLEGAQRAYRALLLHPLEPGGAIGRAEVLVALGEIHERTGDTRRAIQLYERALAADANVTKATERLDALRS